MADKQLTVAELLARAEKENPSGERRPRRRRSLEDGGVSVAELTDSFKKVDVKPAEVKHSSVPIDAPSDTSKKTPKPAQAQPADAAPAASKAQAGQSKRVEVTHVPAKPDKAQPAAPKRAEDAPAEVKQVEVKQAEAKPAAAKPAQGESVKLRPAAKPEAPKPAAAPAAAPAAPKPAAAPAAAAAAPAADETTVLRKVEAKPEAQRATAQPDDTNEIRAVDAPEPQRAEKDIFDEPAAELDEVGDYEVEEASVNPILLVLLVFFGVLLGVLGFLAFKWLWANTMTIVAVLLGIALIAGVVAAVGALGSNRDKITMTIAGLAAAVIAFGPSLL